MVVWWGGAALRRTVFATFELGSNLRARISPHSIVCRLSRSLGASQASVHDAFVAHLTRRVQALKLGSGLEAGTTQGPLISAAAVDRVSGAGPWGGACLAGRFYLGSRLLPLAYSDGGPSASAPDLYLGCSRFPAA